MNNNLKLQLGNIIASFQKTFYEVEHVYTSSFYGNLCGSVLRTALRCIVKEFFRVDYMGTNIQICGCAIRISRGLHCTCELGRYIVVSDMIPIYDVHIHWRKLAMEGQQEVDTDDGSEVDMTIAIEALYIRL